MTDFSEKENAQGYPVVSASLLDDHYAADQALPGEWQEFLAVEPFAFVAAREDQLSYPEYLVALARQYAMRYVSAVDDGELRERIIAQFQDAVYQHLVEKLT